MPLWKQLPDLTQIERWSRATLAQTLGITITEIGDDYHKGTLPVDHRTHQPFGLLHGGASVALAETLGSLAGNLCLDPQREVAVGLEINANHLRSIKSGTVTGTARALHLGKSTQVWQIEIVDEKNRLICVSRLTLAVIAAPGATA